MLKPDREVRFRAIYADAYGDVLRFAQRRVHPSHAEDATAGRFSRGMAAARRRSEEARRRAGVAVRNRP